MLTQIDKKTMQCYLSPFHPRSFERRNSRLTTSQGRALIEYWPQFGLHIENGKINLKTIFGRYAPCLLEIGFGSGQSLLALADAHRDKDFIGIETYRPGIGALLMGIRSKGLTNIRLYEYDAVDVLRYCIPVNSIDHVQLFFPDPWPKRRHHVRRLIQESFVRHVIAVLKSRGTFHTATDWQDYAVHMLRILAQQKEWYNVAFEKQYAERSLYRPVITKFEARAMREGRSIWELQFAKRAF